MAHRLADGTEVKLGMRVVDYDRKHGFIDNTDRNARVFAKNHENRSSAGITPITLDMDGRYTCDAWFDVRCDDGSLSYMDCSRMIAEGGRLDR